MNLWEKYDAAFKSKAHNKAFCISGNDYTYSEFSQYIAASQQLLTEHCGPAPGLPIGVMCYDSIETFAAIFATWFTGHHFVPLHPMHPVALNNEKIQQSGLQLILSSEDSEVLAQLSAHRVVNKNRKSSEPYQVTGQSGRAYILFTSGSTGKPKGVPISEQNMSAYTDGFLSLYPELKDSDRFLQTYDLTSDAAFTGYLIPLLLGACVFTLPSGGFKYLSIVKLLQQHQITFTKFTPSVLNYLRPYFKSMHFDALLHSHFGGEALSHELALEWAKCIPNAEISNGYGPTETTVTCTIHRSDPGQLSEKVCNGIVSIGKPFKNVKTVIVDENNQEVKKGEKGELCIGGPQVMEGYLNTTLESSKWLFLKDEKGNTDRYYRSGDLVLQDEEDFLFFCARKDEQLKISGYRVEPAEIEMAVSQLTSGRKAKAYSYRNQSGTDSIVVFVEQDEDDENMLKDQLRTLLPLPLIPEKIIFIPQFPFNSSGKADKNTLFEKYASRIYE
jgi:amino acid adenylation domain-containing protein